MQILYLTVTHSLRCCRWWSSMLPSEASSDFNVMTPAWVEVVKGCSSRFWLASAVASNIMGLLSFVVGCAFNFARVYLAHYRSVEVDWSFLAVYRVGFHGPSLTDVFKIWLKWFFLHAGQMSGALGADRMYVACTIVWAVPTAESSSLASAIAYIRPNSKEDLEAVDTPLVLSPKAGGICRIYLYWEELMFSHAFRWRILLFNINASSTWLKRRERLLVSSNWQGTSGLHLVSNWSYWRVWNGSKELSSGPKPKYGLFSIKYRRCGLYAFQSEFDQLNASVEVVNCL